MSPIRMPRQSWEALYWVRALINPLLESSCDEATGFMDNKLVMLAYRRYAKYRERME